MRDGFSLIRDLTEECITYSTNGTMIAILRQIPSGQVILSVYDAVRHEHMHDTHLPSEDTPCGLWTHGESLRLAAFNATTTRRTGPKSITVWEVGFTAGATMTVVETLSAPESITFSMSRHLRFPQFTIYPPSPSAPLPVALTSYEDTLVWDARNSKILLRQDDGHFQNITFSPDGQFVASVTATSEVYIWKYSPTGYALHGKLVSGLARGSIPLFSPNGESVIVFGSSTISLWHTKNLTTPLPHNFVDPPHRAGRFLLEILPNRSLAAVMRHEGRTVTLLDIRSGALQLTIDTGMRGLGLGLTEDAVVVIGEGKATTWSLSGGTCFPGTTMNIADSTRTIVLSELSESNPVGAALISPGFRYIIVSEYSEYYLHSATAGEFISKFSSKFGIFWFTPDGHHIGDFLSHNRADIWQITTEGTVELSAEGIDIGEGRWGCPYIPSRGYRIAANGWVFDRSGRRLLILPPLWRSQLPFQERKWSGQFLGLLQEGLPEPVIIDLEP